MKKLKLNKQSIAILNKESKKNINGGGDETWYSCLLGTCDTYANQCGGVSERKACYTLSPDWDCNSRNCC